MRSNLSQEYIEKTPFSLHVKVHKNHSRIIFKADKNYLYSKNLPGTLPILKKNLPAIFFTKCINDNNYCFEEEAKNTEIAHLFEHIILTYLCLRKKIQEQNDFLYKAKTSWNWEKNEIGNFEIDLNVGLDEEKGLLWAIGKSRTLLSRIYSFNN